MSEQKLDPMSIPERQAQIKSLFKGLKTEDIKTVVVEAAKQLPDKEKEAVARDIRGFPPPTPLTRTRLWMIVVSAFALVLVGTFISIAIAMFKTQTADTITLAKPELVLSMFTSVVGFLAGLFVPSPVANK